MAEIATIDETVRAIIETRVQTIWADRTPIQWPGVQGIGGDTGSATDFPPTNSDWLRVNWEYVDTETRTIAPDSGGLDMTSGVIMLTVFTPSGVGEAGLWSLVGAAKSIFNRYNHTIRCGASGARQKMTEGGWTSARVVTPFVFYANTTS